MHCAASSRQTFANTILTPFTGQHFLYSLRSQLSYQLFQKSSFTILLPIIGEVSLLYALGTWLAQHTSYSTLPLPIQWFFFPMSVNSQRAETVPSSIVPVFLNACRAFRPLQMLNMYHWITEWQERKANWPEQGNDAPGLRYQRGMERRKRKKYNQSPGSVTKQFSDPKQVS